MTGKVSVEVDRRWMAAALALADRGAGRTAPNPNVGCLIVDSGDQVIGRGWTQPGGRPHAEAMALAQAGSAATGATVFVTLEPCAHASPRGPACADLLAAARPRRVVVASQDPDPRTNGKGLARLAAAGIDVTSGVLADLADDVNAGFLSRLRHHRPRITLKLATSLDGCIARADGESRWITGPLARAHVHLERARADAILVGRGTFAADQPLLDVRLPGLEERGPRRLLLSRDRGALGGEAGWEVITHPAAITSLADVNDILVEGGAGAAAAFLRADLVDRLLLYRAPILIGGGRSAIADIGLDELDAAHGRWRLRDTRMLGPDRFEDYRRVRAAAAA